VNTREAEAVTEETVVPALQAIASILSQLQKPTTNSTKIHHNCITSCGAISSQQHFLVPCPQNNIKPATFSKQQRLHLKPKCNTICNFNKNMAIQYQRPLGIATEQNETTLSKP